MYLIKTLFIQYWLKDIKEFLKKNIQFRQTRTDAPNNVKRLNILLRTFFFYQRDVDLMQGETLSPLLFSFMLIF